MSAEDAAELLGRFYEEFDKGNLGEAVSAFSEQLEIIDPGMGMVHGRERFREYLHNFKRAMPDAHAVIEHLFASAETVVVEGRFVGTHTGPLATEDGDMAPTGAAVDLRFADVSQVRDGTVVSYHTYYDQFALLSQLGLLGGEF